MYAESHPVRFHGGLHSGALNSLAPYGAHGLRLNGLDPGDQGTWDTFEQQYPNGEGEVELSAHSGDPQLDRDLVTIGRHTMWNGTRLWPTPPPPQRMNMGANYLRVAEGMPQEGTQQIDPNRLPPQPAYLQTTGSTIAKEQGNKQGASVDVSNDMSVLAKWTVVALGELQQPSAVEQPDQYNPVTDGPNPDGPQFGDNAGNSFEQEVALETWVNMAVDALNRGEPEEAVLAQLAHDGCPDPQQALQRALKQPDAAPVSDEAGQNPFEMPPADNSQTPMESVSQQPPVVTGKVRVVGTKLVGTEVERYEDTWGQGSVRIALDEGGSITVAPEQVEPADATAPPSPVSEIQTFIDSFPPVEPHRASIEARIANLKTAKLAAMRAISKSSFSDQVELDRIALAADEEMLELRNWLRSDESLSGDVVISAYEVNKFLPELGVTDRVFAGNVREAAAIWAHESPFFATAKPNADGSLEAAVMFAQSKNMNVGQANEFLAVIREKLAAKTPEAILKVANANLDNDGPAEALFL